MILHLQVPKKCWQTINPNVLNRFGATNNPALARALESYKTNQSFTEIEIPSIQIKCNRLNIVPVPRAENTECRLRLHRRSEHISA